MIGNFYDCEYGLENIQGAKTVLVKVVTITAYAVHSCSTFSRCLKYFSGFKREEPRGSQDRNAKGVETIIRFSQIEKIRYA